jgi:hypothetical protein
MIRREESVLKSSVCSGSSRVKRQGDGIRRTGMIPFRNVDPNVDHGNTGIVTEMKFIAITELSGSVRWGLQRRINIPACLPHVGHAISSGHLFRFNDPEMRVNYRKFRNLETVMISKHGVPPALANRLGRGIYTTSAANKCVFSSDMR